QRPHQAVPVRAATAGTMQQHERTATSQFQVVDASAADVCQVPLRCNITQREQSCLCSDQRIIAGTKKRAATAPFDTVAAAPLKGRRDVHLTHPRVGSSATWTENRTESGPRAVTSRGVSQ